MLESAKCHYCDQPAVKLCDEIVGQPWPGHQRTCDRPLCRDHTTQTGRVHLNFGGGRGGWDSIDKCPEHAGKRGDRR